MYRLGLDFGASTTKIAYLNEQGHLQVFRYPGAIGNASAPTALTCQVHAGKLHTSTLGAAAEFASQLSDTFVCEHFKSMLTSASDKLHHTRDWPTALSPTEILRAYFHHLLWENPHSFTAKIGAIESMAVAIPESWRRTPRHPGSAFLENMFRRDFALPQVSLHGEAICAATYLSHCYKHREGRDLAGSVLLCDMGGSNFRATLCRVYGQQVEVLTHEEARTGGLGPAGIAFDRQIVRTAGAAIQGDLVVRDDKNFRAAVRDFTTLKVQESENVRRLWELQMTTPELADTPLYIMPNKYTVDTNQVRQSFQPMAESMSAALSRLLERASAHAWPVDYLAPVGGSAQYPLVQEILRTYCSSQISLLSPTALQGVHAGPGWEIACGAALLTQASSQLGKTYYPHTLGIYVYRREKGALVETFLPCIEAGTVPLGQSGQYFVYEKGRFPLTIEVASRSPARLPVYIRWRGVGEPQALPGAEVEYPTPGAYHLALAIDSTQHMAVQFQPVVSGKLQTYSLGPIPSDCPGEKP